MKLFVTKPGIQPKRVTALKFSMAVAIIENNTVPTVKTCCEVSVEITSYRKALKTAPTSSI